MRDVEEKLEGKPRYSVGDPVEVQFVVCGSYPPGFALNRDEAPKPVSVREIWKPATVTFCNDMRLDVRFADHSAMSFPPGSDSVRSGRRG